MMLSITIVDLATGIIKRRIDCQDIDVQHQVGQGEGYVVGSFDDMLYSINVATGEAILKPPPPPLPPLTLAEVKTIKSIQIKKDTELAIYAGYNSSALGTAHHYPAGSKDQMNMIASVTDSYHLTNLPTWTTPFWCADTNNVWGYRLHTATQIQQAGADGKAAILVSLSHNATLQGMIAAATTIAQVEAIVW